MPELFRIKSEIVHAVNCSACDRAPGFQKGQVGNHLSLRQTRQGSDVTFT
jgi:hypothetical protein